MQEPLNELFTRSKLLILDFRQIPQDALPEDNIQLYFEQSETKGINPRLPENRQKFNNQLLAKSRARYLISRYGEDRSMMLTGSGIAQQGRTLHLGIDAFCRELETVYAPCDGEIVETGQQPAKQSFGHYLILKPDKLDIPYVLLAHLSAAKVKKEKVSASEPIATIGDYVNNENGGWSRHLHIQMLKTLPRKGQPLIGYSDATSFEANRENYPDPMNYFPHWQLQT